MQDVAIVEKILSARGLKAVPTSEQSIFQQAVSFTNIAAEIFEKHLVQGPPNGSAMAPFVVNAVFGIELYLKTLALHHGKKLHGHKITELFRKLPNVAKKEIEDQIATLSISSQWTCGIDKIEHLRTILGELDTAFTDWRYLHENRQQSPLKITFKTTIFLSEVLHTVCAKYANPSQQSGVAT